MSPQTPGIPGSPAPCPSLQPDSVELPLFSNSGPESSEVGAAVSPGRVLSIKGFSRAGSPPAACPALARSISKVAAVGRTAGVGLSSARPGSPLLGPCLAWGGVGCGGVCVAESVRSSLPGALAGECHSRQSRDPTVSLTFFNLLSLPRIPEARYKQDGSGSSPWRDRGWSVFQAGRDCY